MNLKKQGFYSHTFEDKICFSKGLRKLKFKEYYKKFREASEP
jgi:hypothetical protein